MTKHRLLELEIKPLPVDINSSRLNAFLGLTSQCRNNGVLVRTTKPPSTASPRPTTQPTPSQPSSRLHCLSVYQHNVDYCAIMCIYYALVFQHFLATLTQTTVACYKLQMMISTGEGTLEQHQVAILDLLVITRSTGMETVINYYR